MPLSDKLTPQQVLDLIFKDNPAGYGLSEFTDLGKPIHEILIITAGTVTAGKAKGDVRYYVKCLKKGTDRQILSEKKANPEEIVRQLWIHKLHHSYGYPMDHIEVEYDIHFGTEVREKAADIMVFQKDGKTAKVIVETKRPDRKDGLAQLKSYVNSEGAPVGLWSNGTERVILYRQYPREFEDTLTELPTFNQEPKDVLAVALTLGHLKRETNFKKVVKLLEELINVKASEDDFDELFKLIYAKLYDELEAHDRKGQIVEFRKTDDPDATSDRIQKLFASACERWPGAFTPGTKIQLAPRHLQLLIGPLERLRLTGSSMREMDDAFEYLIPNKAKKKNGQFFTPRHVIDMAVKMLNPKKREYILDPACGSAGFLLHAMDYVWPAKDDDAKEKRKHNYAAKYLFGIDLKAVPARISRALMLIAGDGSTNIFSVDSLDVRDWFTKPEGQKLRQALSDSNLLVKRLPDTRTIKEAEGWDYFKECKFDIILTNPPFAGDNTDADQLRRYQLAAAALKRKSKKGPKVESDVLFIERCLDMLKPGGRLAMVLPQGKFNNSSLAFVREWILRRARLLAVVGLHPNTFKPHTGTKTSVLFLQKYTAEDLARIKKVEDAVKEKTPDYTATIRELLEKHTDALSFPDDKLTEDVAAFLAEWFAEEEEDETTEEGTGKPADEDEDKPAAPPPPDLEELETAVTEQQKTLTGLKLKFDAAREKKDKETQKKLRASIKTVEKSLAAAQLACQEADHEEKKQTTRGQLQIVLDQPEALEALKQRWLDTELAKALDYPIFMATSERGGKDTKGVYQYRTVGKATLEDSHGNPLVDQDCVRYRDEDDAAIAEAFVSWAKKQKLAFWQED